ncbi:bifunctional sugar-1-phosphate nucleotidylyltransferase/acetyltransferase [Halorubellus litoreus]|uniref:Bifunctional protein GlmU n=1 Tax=Halorubellus litoreus TaxID=755308 RepID=A0ABD5VJ98_9EURY
MQAVVLAAGEGTRIRPLSRTQAKPMLPVGDGPLVERTMASAVDAGADELVLVVGYEGDDVREHFGDSYRGTPVKYAEQTEQRGTAHAVKAAADHLDGPFAVLNGDGYFDPTSVQELFDARPAILSYRADDPTAYGVLDTEDGAVTDVVEKPDDPPGNLVNAGAYVFPEEATGWLDVPETERGEKELTDVLERVIDEFAVTPVEVDEWLDVGHPWELLEANERYVATLDRRVDGDVSDDATLEGDVVVEDGATVKAGTLIEGPALVREGATVGPNAYVRGATLIDEGATVGNAVEVKNSIVGKDSSVAHLSYLGDSVLGRNVNFGAGTVVANLRHDDADVKLTTKGERVSTGRRKFGVVAGDDAATGIDTSLNAGVTLGVGATTTPGETLTRDRW